MLCPSEVAPNLTAYRVHLANDTNYVTSMAAGITLEDARKYFVGKPLTQADETTILCIDVTPPDVLKISEQAIRPDLFAVQRYEDCGKKGGWVTNYIFRTIGSARNLKAMLAAEPHRDFPLVAPRIVHPRQWVVEAFVAVGNQIKD
jgi:hypothetical protein